MALDERLKHELERAGRPADPSGVYEDLIRRRERRHIVHLVTTGLLVIGVIAGTAIGLFGLFRLFGEGTTRPAAPGEGVILFTGRVQEGASPQLLTVDVATGQLGVIPGSSVGIVGSAAWSPDGERIVFTRRDEPGMFIMNADGSDPRQLVDHEGVDPGSADPAWSPDGTRIAFTAHAGGFGESVFIVDADGVTTTWIARGSSPSWSRDGTDLVFTDPTGALAIQEADPDAEPHPLGPGIAGYEPDWSPDGSKIVFVLDDKMWVVMADGSDVHRLPVEPGFYHGPTWSPDGSMIAYSFQSVAAANCADKDCSGRYDVWVTDADGTHARQTTHLTSVPSGSPSPDWYPVVGGTPITVPTESTTPSVLPREGEDIGLGFPVCDVTSVGGTFARGVDGRAFVATRAGDTRDCPTAQGGMQVLAVDVTGDGLADTSYGPLECDQRCSAFAAPDVDGDGTDELLVQNVEFSIIGLTLFEVEPGDGGAAIGPVTVAPPGDPGGGFEPGAIPQLWLGGDAFSIDTLRCGTLDGPTGPGFVYTTAESLPHDSPNAEWRAHEVTFVLRNWELHIVNVRDFTEPVGTGPPSFQSGETLCGSNLGPSQA